MARNVRSSRLESRTSRLKLPVAKKPVFVRIGANISLGYRRNQAAGTWVLKLSDGKGGAITKAVGTADDHQDADDHKILSFWHAQEKARSVAQGLQGDPCGTPLTVDRAAEDYLCALTARNPRTGADTRSRLTRFFLPKFGSRRISEITKTDLEKWLASLVAVSDDPERVRRSKDTANRILTMVKAVLNHAMSDNRNRLTDDTPWRRVKPFKGVSRPRETRYTDAEVRHIVASAPDQSTADLIRGAYLTGARYGELASLTVRNFDAKQKTVTINTGKTGVRTAILQQSAYDLFARLVKDRPRDAYIFRQENGRPWKPSDQNRPIKRALSAAGLPSNGNLYAMRHSHISCAIEGSVPLNIISKNCGTSVRMIEKTYAKVLAEHARRFIEAGAPTL